MALLVHCFQVELAFGVLECDHLTQKTVNTTRGFRCVKCSNLLLMVNSSLSPSMYDFQQTIQNGQNDNYCEMSLNLSFPSFFFFCNIIGPECIFKI